MPRNGSGVYSLPSGNPVVDATTIEAAWANTTLTDIATEVTGSLPRNGSAPMAANMGMGGFKILNVANATLATDAATKGQMDTAIAAAVTTHSAAADPHPGYLTPTEGNAAYQPLDAELAAIAGLTSAANTIPRFTGSGTANLVTIGTASGNVPLVGNKSATESVAGLVELASTAEMTAGTADVVPEASKVKAFVDAAIAAIPAPSQAWELVSTTSVTAVAAIAFDLQEDIYCEWKFVLDGIIPANDDTKIDIQPAYGGISGTYLTTGFNTYGTPGVAVGQHVISYWDGAAFRGVGTAAGEHGHAVVTLGGLGSTLESGFSWQSQCSFINEGGTATSEILHGVCNGLTKRRFDAVRFKPSTGNFEATGTIKMYGLKRTV